MRPRVASLGQRALRSLSLSVGLGVGALACGSAAAPLMPAPRVAPTEPHPVVPAAGGTASRAAAPDASAAPPTDVPSPAPSPLLASSTPASGQAPSRAATPESAAPGAPSAELRVEAEPPYSALGHPRLATEMLTLGRDEELFRWALGGSSAPEHPSHLPGYHPATRVVVDVKLLSRAPLGTTKHALALARRNGYWPLRACFEAAQRVSARPNRHARVRLTVGARGKVLGASNAERAEDPTYARCVLTRLRGLDFTPGFGRKLDLEVEVKQWTGSAPLPPRAPDAAAPLAMTSQDRAALEAPLDKLRECYAAARAKDPELWGRLALRLELHEHAVTQASQVETQFPNADVVECARQALLGVHLDSPGISALTWAARLSPAQGAPPAPPAPPLGEPPELSPPAPAPPAPPAP